MMMMMRVFVLMLVACLPRVYTYTDPSDAYVMGEMYESLNSPIQLTNWRASNAIDPCGEKWKGVTCSHSRVTEINLPSLGLSGLVAKSVKNLTSLTTLDMSNNRLGNDIPRSLPQKLERLNLAGCGFQGRFPYSVSTLTSLRYLNLSHNHLVGELTNTFGNFGALSTLDLGFNRFTGHLPESFSLLSNMANMFLQANKFAGTIDVLSHLPLQSLNVANNQFTGRIPRQLQNINLELGGNNWDIVLAPPPPPSSPPPPPPSSPPPPPPPPPGTPKGERRWNTGDGYWVKNVINPVIGFWVLRYIVSRIYHYSRGQNQNQREVELQHII